VRAKIATINTTAQPLNNGDVVNLFTLPKGSVPLRAQLINDTATAGGTAQLGIAGTAGYYASAGQSLAVANTKADAFTNLANLGQETAADQTVILTIGGANVAANTNLTVLLEYTRE